MSTLLLRCRGPMQSWGVQSRFSVRDTGLEPSKSGIVGLLCAALGRPRQAALDDLAELRMGVRMDREGRLERDYHTALDVLKASGGIKGCEPSTRYYLAGACFLVGLEGDDRTLLPRLHDALRNPVWPLYLGRKAFVPGEPVWLRCGLRLNQGLLDALTHYDDLCDDASARRRFVIEDPAGTEVRPDQPISFAERRFAPRRVRTEFITIPHKEVSPCISPA